MFIFILLRTWEPYVQHWTAIGSDNDDDHDDDDDDDDTSKYDPQLYRRSHSHNTPLK